MTDSAFDSEGKCPRCGAIVSNDISKIPPSLRYHSTSECLEVALSRIEKIERMLYGSSMTKTIMFVEDSTHTTGDLNES